jgi:hypothetical protein
MNSDPTVAPAVSDNPHEYTRGGADTKWAPVRLPYSLTTRILLTHVQEHQDVIDNPPVRIGERTDIWNIGAVIWGLMAGNPALGDGPVREDVPPDYEQPVSRVRLHHLQHGSLFPQHTMFPQGLMYSDGLKQLVGWCLEWRVDDRPNIDEIDEFLNDFLDNNTHVRDDMTAPRVLQAPDVFRVGAPVPPGYRQ